MEVRLLAKTTGIEGTEYYGRTIDEIITGIARISSSRELNELFHEPEKLLRHCISNSHWSIFTQANISFEIITSRAIGRELLRHWSLKPQEFCISGDSKIKFVCPSGKPYELSIKELYEGWHYGAKPIYKKLKKVKLEELEDDKLYTSQELKAFDFHPATLRTKLLRGEIPYVEKLNKSNNKTFYIKGSDIKQYYKTEREIVFDRQSRLSNMQVKVFDENTNTFTTSTIKNVFHNGKKPMYKISLKNNKTIVCTKEHRFYDGESFKSLEDITNLQIDNENNVISFNSSLVAVNGVPTYQDFNYLKQLKEESITNKLGLNYIAESCGVSYHTIRKWLKIHNLQFTKKETALYKEIWNKGKTGYNIKARSLDSRIKQSENTPKGKQHHAWKGGGRSERNLIQNYINGNRAKIYQANGGIFCSNCYKTDTSLELHHIEPVTYKPERAYDLTNITPLCHECHWEKHRELNKTLEYPNIDLDNYDWQSIRPSNVQDYPQLKFNSKKYKGKYHRKETKHMSEITDIVYVGELDSYDLEVNHSSHNYVANSIVVHNSQRYAEATAFEDIELRLAGSSNRQSSTDVFDKVTFEVDKTSTALGEEVYAHIHTTEELYRQLLEQGVAKETARFILPETTQTKLVFNGSIREWITTLNQRLHKTAQKECRLVAEAIRDIFTQECPIISAALFNFEDAYDIHILDRVVLEKYGIYQMIKDNQFKKIK